MKTHPAGPTLQEGAGVRLQVMLSLAEVGEEALAEWKHSVDSFDEVVRAVLPQRDPDAEPAPRTATAQR